MAEPGDNITIIGAIADNGKHGWDLLWKASVTHWDRGQADPYLVAFLKAPPAAVKIPDFGMGLVAGCGRGYDAAALAEVGEHKRSTWGLDLSETAVAAAKEWLASRDVIEPDARRVEIHCADFFTFEPPSEGFSLAWDLTFLCALPPNMRDRWADRYTELLSSQPDSLLLTACWPMSKEENQHTGPPWILSPQIYKDLLEPRGWKLVWEGEFGERGRLLAWEL